MPAAHIDFETASACDLMKAGVYRYAEHPSTKTWGFTWCIDEGPILRWMPGYEDPTILLTHVASGGMVVAHNANFERIIWNMLLRLRYGLTHWPIMQPHQQSCTMARAYAMNLPGKLEKVAQVLGVENLKDMQGAAVMRKMMRPRNVNPDGSYIWWDEGKGGAELLEKNMMYCEQDTRAERDVDKKLPMLSEAEQQLWIFDQIINERGVKFDMPLVNRAIKLVDVAKKDADRKMRKITGGAVRKVSEPGKLVTWLNDVRGIPCESMKKGNIKELVFQSEMIDDDTAKAAIKLRKSASKTSTAKYAKMLECVSSGDRIRFLLAFHAASTGRWAGRLVQPQNFPRFDQENPEERAIVEWLIEMLNSDMTVQEVYDCMDAVHGEALEWLAKMLRSTIIADTGKKLIGGDFSNVEGRANVWLAGEAWKIEAFLAYDRGEGPDLYKVAYASSFGIPIEEVTKPKRQIGKVQELASGYQGGVGAYLSMAEIYDIEVYDLARIVQDGVSAEKWDDIAVNYAGATDKHGLHEFEWTALKLLVTGWRKAHPNVVQSWWDYQDAVIAAVEHTGQVIDVADMSDVPHMQHGRIRYMSDGAYLYCCLPNQRVISYAQPWLEYETVEKTRPDGSTYEYTKTNIRFWGVDSVTKQWSKQALYGGLLCENVVQAVSRDLLVEAMFRVEHEGYPIILTVHDEILAEPDLSFGSAEHFEQLMSIMPAWAEGLPLAVAAWEDQRYVK